MKEETASRFRSMVAMSFLAVSIIVVPGLFLAHAFYLRCVAEDAFISFRFARNLAAGHGLVWNIGEAPVEGFTNFLWVVLCAGAIRTGWNVIVLAQVVGVLAGLATLVFVYRFAVKAMRISAAGGIAACFLLACAGPFATWATSGMETVPFTLAVLVGTYGLVRFAQEQRACQAWLGALSMLAAVLLRPEGVMVCAVVGGMCFLLWNPASGRSRWMMLWPGLLFGTLFLMYFVWRSHYFGYLLPNTFYAKTGGGLPQQIRGVKYALDFAVFYVLPLLPLGMVALWEWARSPLKRRQDFRLKAVLRQELSAYRLQAEAERGFPPGRTCLWHGSPRPCKGVLAVCLAVVFVYALYIIYVGGDYMAMYRFWVPLLPFIALLAGWIVSFLWIAAGGRGTRTAVIVMGIMLTCGFMLWPSTPLEAVMLRKPTYHHGRFQGVYRERWHTARLTVIGRFFAQYRNDYSEVLATDAIGAIGYYSNMKILGMHGLVDPHIAHLKTGEASLGTGFPGHEKGDMAYIFSRKPDYVMFSRNLTPHPLGWPTFGPELDPGVRRNYRLESEWITDTANGEAGFFTFLVSRDRG